MRIRKDGVGLNKCSEKYKKIIKDANYFSTPGKNVSA